jgi:hypothetical protein
MKVKFAIHLTRAGLEALTLSYSHISFSCRSLRASGTTDSRMKVKFAIDLTRSLQRFSLLRILIFLVSCRSLIASGTTAYQHILWAMFVRNAKCMNVK